MQTLIGEPLHDSELKALERINFCLRIHFLGAFNMQSVGRRIFIRELRSSEVGYVSNYLLVVNNFLT